MINEAFFCLMEVIRLQREGGTCSGWGGGRGQDSGSRVLVCAYRHKLCEYVCVTCYSTQHATTIRLIPVANQAAGPSQGSESVMSHVCITPDI